MAFCPLEPLNREGCSPLPLSRAVRAFAAETSPSFCVASSFVLVSFFYVSSHLFELGKYATSPLSPLYFFNIYLPLGLCFWLRSNHRSCALHAFDDSEFGSECPKGQKSSRVDSLEKRGFDFTPRQSDSLLSFRREKSGFLPGNFPQCGGSVLVIMLLVIVKQIVRKNINKKQRGTVGRRRWFAIAFVNCSCFSRLITLYRKLELKERKTLWPVSIFLHKIARARSDLKLNKHHYVISLYFCLIEYPKLKKK